MILCSFCGLTSEEAQYVFTGPVLNGEILAICSVCVRYCEVTMHQLDARAAERERQANRADASRLLEGWIY